MSLLYSVITKVLSLELRGGALSSMFCMVNLVLKRVKKSVNAIKNYFFHVIYRLLKESIFYTTNINRSGKAIASTINICY
jgi:hypothetical protein